MVAPLLPKVSKAIAVAGALCALVLAACGQDPRPRSPAVVPMSGDGAERELPRRGSRGSAASTHRCRQPPPYALEPVEDDGQLSVEQMKRQARVEGLAERVARYTAERAPDSHAGLFINGDRVHVGFSQDLARHRRALLERGVSPRRLCVFPAEYSERALKRLQERITDDMVGVKLPGLDWSSVSIEVWSNRVMVGLRNPSQRARRLVRERYGPAVAMEEAPIDVEAL